MRARRRGGWSGCPPPSPAASPDASCGAECSARSPSKPCEWPWPARRARARRSVKRCLGMILKGLIVPAGCSTSGARGASTALQPVANRPLVCHALDELRGAGVMEVVLLGPAWEEGELRACVEAAGPAGLDIEYVPYEDDAFEQALEVAAKLVGEAACMVHVPDGLLAQPLAPLVGLLREGSPDLVALVHHSSTGGGSIGLATRRVLRLAWAAPEDAALDRAGAGLFGPGALRRASAGRWWQGRELDLVSVAEQLVDGGG